MKPLMSVVFSDLCKWPTWNEYLAAMQPRAVMWLIGGETPEKSGARASYSLCPQSWIVLRMMQFEPGFNTAQLVDPLGVARRWAECIEAAMPYIEDPARTLVCGPFCMFGDWAKIDRLVEMESELVARTWQDYGIRSIIGSFAVGTPEPDIYERYAPALRAARANNAVLGLHQYFQLTAADESLWTSERDQLWGGLWADDPNTRVPVMVLETGVEHIWNRAEQAPILKRLTNGIPTPGWKSAGAAISWRGFNQSCEEFAVSEAKKLDRAWSKRPYMKAGFWFMSTKEERWRMYDPEPIMPEFVDWIGGEPITGLMSLDPEKWVDEPYQPEPAPEPEEPEPDPVVGVTYSVNSDVGLNARIGPGTENPRAFILRDKSPATVVAFDGDWAELALPMRLFVHRDYLKR